MAALVLAGCGSGNDGPSRAAWAAAAAARCRTAMPAEQAIARRQTALAGAQSPKRFFPAAAQALRDDVALDRRLLDAIGLIPSPEEGGDEVEDWLLSARRRVAATASLAQAYEQADDKAIAQAAELADARDQGADRLADGLGLAGCAAIV